MLITAIFFTQSLILGCSTEVDSEIKKMEEEKQDVSTIPLKMFTVTYKSEFADDDVQSKAEGTVLELPTPLHKGYRFDGWYTNAEKTTKAAATYTIAENLTFYAKWVQQVTVKFTSAQSEHADVTVDLGTEITIEDPTKEKFDFDGWYDGKTKVSGKYTVTKDVELVAIWTALYNVTYETDGTPVKPETVRAGTKIKLPPTTLDGYDFEWWATEGKTYAIGAEYEVNSDVIFVAKWAGLCRVVYNTDGGSSVESKTVHDMETIEMPAAPTKDGHRFLGWYTTDENNLMQPGDVFNVTDSVTINAKWIAVYTYEYNDGIPADEDPNYQAPTVDDGYVLTLKAAPVRDGYVFKGWSVDEQIYQPGASYTITANVVFEAIWVELFTYEYNDGIPADEDPNYQAPTAEAGEVLTLKSAPIREGYVFKGWKVGEQLYDADATYTITADVVFVAVWNVTVTVTYVSEHTDHEKVTIEKGSTLDLPTTPTVEGYDFDGWFNEGDEKVDSPYTVDANITLTAKWTKLWTVTYMSDGVEIDSEIVRDGESIVLKAPSIPKTGYTFDCWQDGEAWINADSIEITADITLTARWEKIPVTYSISGVPTTGWGVVEVYVYNEAEGRENGEPLGNKHAVDGEGNITFETAKDITHCILVSFGDPDPSSEMPSYSNLEDLLNVSSTYSEDLNVTSGKATFVQYVPKVTYTIKNAEGYNTPYVTIDGEEVASVYNSETKTVTFEYAEDLTGCLIAKNDSHSAEKEIIFDENGIGMINSQYSFVIDPNQVYFRNSKNWHGGIQVYAYHSSDPKNEVRIDMTKAADTDQWYYADVDYSLYDTVYFAGQTTNNTNDNGETVSIKLDKSKIFYRPSDNRDSSLGEDSGGRDKFNVKNFEKINDYAPGFN